METALRFMYGTTTNTATADKSYDWQNILPKWDAMRITKKNQAPLA